ncbi:hypothetical protein, partial [Phenylobacterium sp.]|uniref:hypothetical protein n=1 Tax=Phenylobacterium sp. TaxID=1871053 RepID=UPI002DE62EC4|nr:hypothetical protein [Phenylobacterium sp.]
LAILAAALGVGWPIPARSDTFSSAPGSAYAIARQTCARQGKILQLYSDQTSDKDTAVSVTVKSRCVAAAKVGPRRTAKRPKRGPR